MKNFIIVILLILGFTGVSNSQTIGINLSSNYTFYQANSELTHIPFVPGVGVGITYKKAIGNHYALLTGLDFQNFNYHLGINHESPSNVQKVLSSRVINNLIQIPLMLEHSFEAKKVEPFIRVGVALNGFIPGGTTDRVHSNIGKDDFNSFDNSVSSSSEIYRTKKAEPSLGASPIGEFGISGQINKQHWDLSLSAYPIFNIPEYSMLYRIDENFGSIQAPENAIVSQLRFRFYLK